MKYAAGVSRGMELWGFGVKSLLPPLFLMICVMSPLLLFVYDSYADQSQGDAESGTSHEFLPEHDLWSEEENTVDFSVNGFVELESFLDVGGERKKRERIIKAEVRNRSDVKYGTDETYGFVSSDIYCLRDVCGTEDNYTYLENSGVERNLRISGEQGEASLNECYLNVTKENFRFRAGNQKYGWGTADFLNPTAYFNPYDLREFIFKGEDEYTIGVPSLSAVFFGDSLVLEAVATPVQVPSILPQTDQFWAIKRVEGDFPVVIGKEEKMKAALENVGFGMRLSGSYGHMDCSVSGYHGPDREPVFLPSSIVFDPGGPASVLVTPEYHIINAAGFDFSMNLDAVVVHAEASYSPDKSGFVEQDLTAADRVTFPFEVQESQFISVASGFNWFIPMGKLIEGHEGDSVFSFEWYFSRYLDRDMNPSIIPDMFITRFEDSYFNGSLFVKLTGIYEYRRKGTVFWPLLGYDFQNGLSVEISFADINAEGSSSWENDSLFYYFKDNDMVTVKVRYAY